MAVRNRRICSSQNEYLETSVIARDQALEKVKWISSKIGMFNVKYQSRIVTNCEWKHDRFFCVL